MPLPQPQLTEINSVSQLRKTDALMSTPSAGSVSVIGVDSPLPFTFELRQNYPNPFNPTTTIEFSVGADNESVSPWVKLEIFNILGQQISTLKDEQMSPGNYKIEWNATDRRGQRVATGIYLYRLRVGDEQQTKKMVLLK